MRRTAASNSKSAALAGAASLAATLALSSGPAYAACNDDTVCPGGPARIMLLLDASSAQLNNGNSAAGPGQGDWDLFRSLVASGSGSLFDVEVQPGGPVASQIVHFGLIVYGGDTPAPGQHKRVVDYWPCTQPNIDWALDPSTSCAAPGCTDPYAGPPIDWTFVDGAAENPPGFDLETLSHMPSCDGDANACQGSTRHVDLGVALATSNREAHASTTPWTHDDSTLYANILLTSGRFDSDPMMLRSALEAAFAAGITTYVVGFGAGAQTPTPGFQSDLDDMAQWGSGGAQTSWQARNEAELRDALAEVLQSMELPCCERIDCAHVGGADDGGGDGDTDTDTGSDWGGLDGGSVSAGTGADSGGGTATGITGTGGAATSGTGGDGSGAIDDDGGCTCTAAGARIPAAWLITLLLAVRRRRVVGTRDIQPTAAG